LGNWTSVGKLGLPLKGLSQNKCIIISSELILWS
jgi:hypothetical protein